MFEIGFSELVLVGIVALIVFGPDKLPGLARNVGLWVGRIRRMVNSVQSDLQREMAKADELQRLLEEQKRAVEQHEIIEELKSTVPITGKPTPPSTNATIAAPSAENTPAIAPTAPPAQTAAVTTPPPAPHDVPKQPQ